MRSVWIGNLHDNGLDYGYARICRKYQRGWRFSETPKMVFSLGGKWLENNLKRSWKWRCKQSFAFARTFRQSIVKSKILPIVFVEDTPMKFSSKTYQLRRWCQILVQLSLSLNHLNYVYVWLIDQIKLFQPTSLDKF